MYIIIYNDHPHRCKQTSWFPSFLAQLKNYPRKELQLNRRPKGPFDKDPVAHKEEPGNKLVVGPAPVQYTLPLSGHVDG